MIAAAPGRRAGGGPDYEVLGRAAVTLEDLKTFHRLDSRCPGHPEYHRTSEVEATTGPPGLAVANSVGTTIAGRWLAERYNREDMPVYDFHVYALAGADRLVAPGRAGLPHHISGKILRSWESSRLDGADGREYPQP